MRLDVDARRLPHASGQTAHRPARDGASGAVWTSKSDPGSDSRLVGETLPLDLPLEAVTRDLVETVDEQDAIQVIDLVLEHAGQEPRRAPPERRSGAVHRFDHDPLGPADIRE